MYTFGRICQVHDLSVREKILKKDVLPIYSTVVFLLLLESKWHIYWIVVISSSITEDLYKSWPYIITQSLCTDVHMSQDKPFLEQVFCCEKVLWEFHKAFYFQSKWWLLCIKSDDMSSSQEIHASAWLHFWTTATSTLNVQIALLE